MKKPKYIILFVLIILLILIFYTPITYKSSPSSSHLPELVGAIHVHSHLSDGRLSVEEIAKDAKRSGLDFVIITDHGNPNLEIIEKEGIINDVSIISGSELSLFDGNLLAIGVKKPTYKISPFAKEAIEDIKDLGGISIITHTEDKKNNQKIWEVRGINGMEIITLSDEIRKRNPLSIIYSFLLYPFNSRFAMLRLVERPLKEIEIWDRELKEQRISGLFGLNLHGKIWIFPFSYAKIFNLIRIHIPIHGNKPDKFEKIKSMVMESLKEGNFFSAIDGAGEAKGFRFYATNNGKRAEMGARTDPGSTLFVELPFPSKFESVIYKDGKKFFSSGKRKIERKIEKEGVYRVEVYLKKNRALKSSVPWILSNPIFARRERILQKDKEPSIRKVSYFNLKNFSLENDKNSQGRIVFHREFLEWNYKLGFSSSSHPHVWCALSLRKNFSLKGFGGIGIEAEASPAARLWLQLRDMKDGEERWWSVSSKIKESWSKKNYSFNEFRLTEGKNGSFNLEKITGIFLIIDKGSMWEGGEGVIKIKSIYLFQ